MQQRPRLHERFGQLMPREKQDCRRPAGKRQRVSASPPDKCCIYSPNQNYSSTPQPTETTELRTPEPLKPPKIPKFIDGPKVGKKWVFQE
eukprot:5892826-Amphidinium_carterae.1